MKIIECVPNFSEGMDAGVVRSIEKSIAGVDGCAVLDRTLDTDHNRSVITFAGDMAAVREAAFRGIESAAQLIDMRRQHGVHPRVGATDVVPFVPVKGASMADCIDAAHTLGNQVWERLGIPVYFYEAAALKPERVRLENVRRGEFEALRSAAQSDAARAPDIGGPALHPTAGAVVIGARKFLIAWNVNLRTGDLTVARKIARTIRESSGGFRCVKALGLFLASRNLAQVSMNLTDFEITSMQTVFDAIAAQAALHGVSVLESEVIGLIPQRALENTDPDRLQIRNFGPAMILENRIAELLPSQAG